MNWLQKLLTLDFLSGYRAMIGSVSSMLAGAVGLVEHFANPLSPLALPVASAILLISTGMTGLGIRFKK